MKNQRQAEMNVALRAGAAIERAQRKVMPEKHYAIAARMTEEIFTRFKNPPTVSVDRGALEAMLAIAAYAAELYT
jgi:hypothetical protein